MGFFRQYWNGIFPSRDQSRVSSASCIAGRFFTRWAMGEATRMDISKQWIISFGKDVDKFEPFIHCWRECKLMQLLWRIAWQFFKNFNVKLPLDLSVTLLGTLQKRKHIHTNTWQHSNIVHKAKNVDSAIPLLGIYPRELIICVLTKTYKWMFTGTLFIMLKSENNPNVHQLMNRKILYICTVEYYLAIKNKWGPQLCYHMDEP